MPLIDVLLLDVGLFVTCSTMLFVFGRITMAHPAAPYLVFHAFTVTTRLIAINAGSPTLFATWGPGYEPIRTEEIARAVASADIAMVAMTAVWLTASRWWPRPVAPTRASLRLDPRLLWAVVCVSLPIGLMGLLAFSRLPGNANDTAMILGDWSTSSYLRITQMWVGLALIALLYAYGFRWPLLLGLAAFLLIMALQGYHRFRVVIPSLMLLQVWLDRTGRRWPPMLLAAPIGAAALLFFPLKTIGRMLQQGAPLSAVWASAAEQIQEVLSGDAPDHQFLDQFACALTLLDANGKLYLGESYLALVTLPIPRQLWPDKPGLAEFMYDISWPSRPMAENGMIVTFLGEAYANFGSVGMVVIPGLFALAMAWFYHQAYSRPYLSVARFAYVLVSVNLIQVYRDGLISIVVFTFVNMMPLMALIVLHLVLHRAGWLESSPGRAAPTVRPTLGVRNKTERRLDASGRPGSP